MAIAYIRYDSVLNTFVIYSDNAGLKKICLKRVIFDVYSFSYQSNLKSHHSRTSIRQAATFFSLFINDRLMIINYH